MDATSPLLFHGQQDDERILHVIRPHGVRLLLATLTAGCIAGLLSIAGYVAVRFLGLAEASSLEPAAIHLLISFTGIVCALGFWAWQLYVIRTSRAYITDRRFVRIEPSFPFFFTKRALFWNEVAKVKAYAPSLLFRFLNVGTLQFQPTITPLEDVRVSYVYYFEDLANYVDKILFKHKTRPDELRDIHAFVLKPKGQRY